jgi:Tol biopolymer transport system component
VAFSLAAVMLVGVGVGAVSAAGAVTERVSISTSGVQANQFSDTSAVSADGRFVAFTSLASNLVPGDTNDANDVFVRDRLAGLTERVSVSSTGAQGNGESFEAEISANGRFVVFVSGASNLVAGDSNDAEDVFVRDLATGITERVSVSSDGTQANSGSFGGTISADGRVVAFTSYATNLVVGDTNGRRDVFVRTRTTGRTQRVSVSSKGAQADSWSEAPAVSGDGGIVVFVSRARNLVAGDTNREWDVFLRNRATARTRRVSVSSTGRQGRGPSFDPAISADGRLVTFTSAAKNLVAGDTSVRRDIFVRNRATGRTRRVSVSSTGAEANGLSLFPAISADGRLVVFTSGASNLVGGDTNRKYDIFVHDRVTGQTHRVSVSSTGTQANNQSLWPAISADGRVVAFTSYASNLASGDTNHASDVFLRIRR